MIPRPFELHTPTTLQEAISLLRSKRDSRVLAGGQSLVPLMKLRLVSPAGLVDIGRIPGLSYIRKEKGRLLIGPMTVHNDVAMSPLVSASCTALSEAASRVGDHQVRNRGTIGGTVCHADPAADVPAALVALDAVFTLTGRAGKRELQARRFFRDVFTTSLRGGEILTRVSVPVLPPRSGSAYLKLGRGASDLAIVGVAAAITLDKKGACEDVKLGLAGVGLTPIRATKAEELLKGREPTTEAVAEAGEAAAKISKPSSDTRGSAEYKTEMVRVYVKRAIGLSLSRI